MPGAEGRAAGAATGSLGSAQGQPPRYSETLRRHCIRVPVSSQLVDPPPQARDNFLFPEVIGLILLSVLVTGDASCQRTPRDGPRTCMTGSVPSPSCHLCVPGAGLRDA